MTLVTGGRKFTDYFPLYDALDQVDVLCFHAKPRLQMVVLEGGAAGADRLAGMWAQDNNIHLIIERANWKMYGNAAGPLRNQLMIDKYHPDICIAMPGGNGTADMVGRCLKAGVPVYSYKAGEDDGR